MGRSRFHSRSVKNITVLVLGPLVCGVRNRDHRTYPAVFLSPLETPSMKSLHARSLLLLCASLATAGFIAACGGGGSSAPVTTTVSGSVVKGPVNGANVCAYKATS